MLAPLIRYTRCIVGRLDERSGRYAIGIDTTARHVRKGRWAVITVSATDAELLKPFLKGCSPTRGEIAKRIDKWAFPELVGG